MIVTFYKGIEIKIWSTHINLLNHGGNGTAPQQAYASQGLGAALAASSSLSSAIWLIIQVIYR